MKGSEGNVKNMREKKDLRGKSEKKVLKKEKQVQAI